ncbi:MAG TPA: amidohydrolase family protein, partial [Galbitalea sp.]|nr:amidohydrolase family protein [Galbitalea sp.]
MSDWQPEETVLYVNGRVWAGAGHQVGENSAISVSGSRISAVGDDSELTDRFRDATRVDLEGHTVIPGLIDAHNHAIRGGATWTRELHWDGLRTRDAALATIAEAASVLPKGSWICAIGGWHQTQFQGGWLPSRAELDAVAPNHPVYVQSLYEVGIASTRAIHDAGLSGAMDRLPGLVELDAAGSPTGMVFGLPAYNLFLAAAGAPTPDEQVEGTRRMFREFAALGMTGICDPGGFGMAPEKYGAIYELWRRGELDVRTRMYLSATDSGVEYEQVRDWLRFAQHGFGDDWLRVTGIGEVVQLGCHDFEGLTDFAIDDEALEELFRISSLVASRGWPLHIHAVLDDSIARILDCWERVHAITPIDGLRFSLAHADRIGASNIARLKALGVGVVMDARQVFRSGASQAVWGADSLRSVPPLHDLSDAEVPLGLGSDATRASSHNPWLTLWWLVAGRSLDGSSERDGRHLAARAQALDLHTRGSAWFSFDEGTRGTIAAGLLADFVA